jgi:conjugative relaxase-like TrwC/TraI family protein
MQVVGGGPGAGAALGVDGCCEVAGEWLGLGWLGRRRVSGVRSVFVPRKFQAKMVASVGGDLWGYLVGGREQADYYLGHDGTPCQAVAELHGHLWARLGLERLDRVAFQRLAAGCHPLTGARLVKTSHVTRLDPATGTAVPHGGMHVPGIDCNLSPPKAVSTLLPFVSPEERAALERAHLAAVRVTLTELQARVAACRPTVNGQQVHTPGELGVAVFTHHTSRPTAEVTAEAGRPPDPQLHSHAFIFNLAWCQGRYLAVDSRPLYQFATTAEAIYACQLAAELQRLGYQLTWRQTRKGHTWELQGVDRRLLELFSTRHRQVERQVADFQARRRRPPTLRERCRLAARDRATKTDACRAPHWPAYRAVLQRHGLQAPTAHRERQRQRLVPLGEREKLVRTLLLAPDGLTGQDATFDQAALTKAVYQAATGLLDATEAGGFLERFAAGLDLVPVATPDGPRYTTTTLLAQEREIVRVARIKAHTRHLAPTAAILANAVQLSSLGGVRLSAEQQAALEHLAAPVGWASLVGHAGTGKTTLVRTLVHAYQANLQPVVLVATAAETARRTARDLGLDRGWTVEAFTRAVRTGHLQPRNDWVVLVEEGGHDGHPPHGRPPGSRRSGRHSHPWGSRAGPAGRRRRLAPAGRPGNRRARPAHHRRSATRSRRPGRVCRDPRRPRPPGAGQPATTRTGAPVTRSLLGDQGDRACLGPAPSPPRAGRREDRDRHRQPHCGCP